MSLENVTYKDTTPFVPPITGGKVIKVYDGDTLTLATTLPFEGSPMYRFSVRTKGIDCPEMRTKNANEKHCAKLARDMIRSKCLNKIVELRNVELEKYGRILADIYVDGVDIKTFLLEANLAVAYDGGTKITPEDWLAYYNSSQSNSAL
jgi:endonuclease YncB( thermonuclease family)